MCNSLKPTEVTPIISYISKVARETTLLGTVEGPCDTAFDTISERGSLCLLHSGFGLALGVAWVSPGQWVLSKIEKVTGKRYLAMHASLLCRLVVALRSAVHRSSLAVLAESASGSLTLTLRFLCSDWAFPFFHSLPHWPTNG
jgi:hypothetical protein